MNPCPWFLKEWDLAECHFPLTQANCPVIIGMFQYNYELWQCLWFSLSGFFWKGFEDILVLFAKCRQCILQTVQGHTQMENKYTKCRKIPRHPKNQISKKYVRFIHKKIMLICNYKNEMFSTGLRNGDFVRFPYKYAYSKASYILFNHFCICSYMLVHVWYIFGDTLP